MHADLMMTEPRSSSRRLSVLKSFIKLIMKCVKYELSRPRAELLSRFCMSADRRSVSSIFCDSGNLCATRLDEISAKTSRSTNTTYRNTACNVIHSLTCKEAALMSYLTNQAWKCADWDLNIWTILVICHFSCHQ